jgi:hypothetical protein
MIFSYILKKNLLDLIYLQKLGEAYFMYQSLRWIILSIDSYLKKYIKFFKVQNKAVVPWKCSNGIILIKTNKFQKKSSFRWLFFITIKLTIFVSNKIFININSYVLLNQQIKFFWQIWKTYDNNKITNCIKFVFLRDIFFNNP